MTTDFANPYLTCDTCRAPVTGFQSDGNLVPCGHHADITSVCPSWSPVDGCQCRKRLGLREHELRGKDAT